MPETMRLLSRGIPLFSVVRYLVCPRALISTRYVDARTVTDTTYTNNDRGSAHLLGWRRQGRRRLRGLLRWGLGERDEGYGRERGRFFALSCTMDRQRQRWHGTRGGRGVEGRRRKPGGLRSPRRRPPPQQLHRPPTPRCGPCTSSCLHGKSGFPSWCPTLNSDRRWTVSG